jgi:hypothetical protein
MHRNINVETISENSMDKTNDTHYPLPYESLIYDVFNLMDFIFKN